MGLIIIVVVVAVAVLVVVFGGDVLLLMLFLVVLRSAVDYNQLANISCVGVGGVRVGRCDDDILLLVKMLMRVPCHRLHVHVSGFAFTL